MSAIHQSSLPIDHLVAESAAYPFASEAALESCIVSLDPTMANAGTARLWRAAEPVFLRASPGLSIDDLVSIRDRTWFPGHFSRAPIALVDVLQGLSERWRARLQDGDLQESTWRPSGESAAVSVRRAWRWLTFSLPSDLLSIEDGSLPQDAAPVSPTLAHALRSDGFAETHLHIGAAVTFPTLWAALQRSCLKDVHPEEFHSPGAGFDGGRRLLEWILRAAIGRVLLAEFLCRHGGRSFSEFLCGEVYPRLSAAAGASVAQELRAALRDLLCGRIADTRGPGVVRLRHIAAELIGRSSTRLRDFGSIAEIYASDPLARWFPIDGSGRSAEANFLRWSFAALRRQALDREGELLLWQIVRIRCLYYRHVVQRPMTPGMQWFIRFYARCEPVTDAMSMPAVIRSALAVSGQGRGLRSLEIRKAPNANLGRLLSFLRSVELACPPNATQQRGDAPAPAVEVGVVFHLPRMRGRGAQRGLPGAYGRSSHADPGDLRVNSGRYRYSSYYRDARRRALALCRVFDMYPYALEVVRGIDVCTDELGVPTWVLAPLVSVIRASARRAGERLLQHRERCNSARPSRSHGEQTAAEMLDLRSTIHAGEDFTHLLGGLRRVAQTIEHFRLREGDRLGHAVALGVDATDWARRVGRVSSTKEERLFDLSWELDWYGRNASEPRSDRVVFLRREIPRLAEEIFGAVLSVEQVAKLVRDLHIPSSLHEVGFPLGPQPREFGQAACRSLPAHVLFRYLCAPEVFQRSQQVEWIDTEREAAVLEHLQRDLRGVVARAGLVVEINPSSNLLIGNLGDIEKHPLWRMRPPLGNGTAPPLRVCVGSDNPITFATGLPSEYQLLFDALLSGGLSEDEAMQWISSVQQTSRQAAFTLPVRHSFEEWRAPSVPPIDVL